LKSRGAIRDYALIGALMAAGLLIRLRGLEGWYFSPDEAMVIDFASLASAKEFLTIVPGSGHPPLFFLMVRLLTRWSLDPVFLRSISLLTGIAMVPVFFALGRKACGEAAGMAMAFLATFGAGATLMSSLLRPYSLEVLLISSALYFLLDGLKRDRPPTLLLYLLFMTLAIWVHYSALIIFGATSATWIFKLALDRSPLKKWLGALGCHLPTLATLAAMYYFFLRGAMGSDNQSRALEGWLKPYFASGAGSLLKNLIMTFDFCIGWPSPYLLGLAAAIGLIFLYQKYSREAATLSIMALGLALVMNVMKLSPLGATRHSYYLFPVLSLLIGSACQYCLEFFRLRAADSRGRRSPWPTVSLVLSPEAMIVAIMIASIPPLVGCLENPDYYRTRDQMARWEFSLTSQDHAQAMAVLTNRIPPGAVALTDSSTSLYLTLGSQSWTLPPDFPRVVKLAVEGRIYEVSALWTFFPEGLAKQLSDIEVSPNLNADSIYVFNMGDSAEGLRQSLSRLGQDGLAYDYLLDRSDTVVCIIRLRRENGPAVGP